MPEVQTDQLEQVVRDSKYAVLSPEEQEASRKEEAEAKKISDEYNQARNFDSYVRSQYAVDRRYAAGTADARWAVTTNLIGSFIDILTSFLYARDPEVRVKKAPQVDNVGTRQQDTFAKTMELVISNLWKRGRLKSAIRKQVRSVLSVGPGYLKVLMIADEPNNPQFQSEMNDLRDNIERLEAVEKSLQEVPEASTEQVDVELAEQRELMVSLEKKIEAAIRRYLAIDFVPAQDYQCSLDVFNTEDYLDADWNANATYIRKSEGCAKFPRLKEDEIKAATVYYQRRIRNTAPLTDQSNLPRELGGGISADEAEQFSKGDATTSPNAGSNGNTTPDNGPEFMRVVELWDKRTNHIKTFVEGVKRWAKEPYQPNYASTRFYPYFRLAFYEVDGERHPQSLTGRLFKLQDEYSASRSGWRLMRERAIPATIFDSTNIEQKDVKKIQDSTYQEYIGVKPIREGEPIKDSFFPKSYEHVDPRMFENGPIKEDMEKMSGVQEALQSSATQPKTATEANIQQSGFASRTTSDRDSLEDMLTDLANYTAEVTLQALPIRDVQRIAGAGAFWPAGLSIDDIVTMVQIEIKAGSTGKPGADNDKQAWGVLLPVIKDAIIQIGTMVASGDPAQIQIAKGLSELVRKTMSIMGDDTDPELFLPPIPDIPEMGMGGPLGVPPVPGLDPNLPPTEGMGEPGGAPSDGPILENPVLEAPVLEAPAV